MTDAAPSADLRVKVLTYQSLERHDYTEDGHRMTDHRAPARAASAPRPLPALRSALALLVVGAFAAPAAAAPPPVRRPTAPLPSPLADARAARTTPVRPLAATRAATPDTCPGLTVPPGKAPFAPGEELVYDLSVSGLYLGKVELKAGRPRSVEGRRAESFFGRARTSGFASALKSFAGRYMAVVESDTYHPVELHSEATYGEDPRSEVARFSGDHQDLSTTYRMNGKTADRSYARGAPVYDMLTLLYHARRLPLTTGMTLCQEVYADKRLWRLEAEVMGTETMGTPVGERPVLKVVTHWVRLPHPDFNPKGEPPWFDVDIYFTQDAYKAPVAFVARTKDFSARGDLVRWATADREAEVGGWSF